MKAKTARPLEWPLGEVLEHSIRCQAHRFPFDEREDLLAVGRAAAWLWHSRGVADEKHLLGRSLWAMKDHLRNKYKGTRRRSTQGPVQFDSLERLSRSTWFQPRDGDPDPESQLIDHEKRLRHVELIRELERRARPTHAAVLRELLAGATQKEAAERSGVSAARVSQLLRLSREFLEDVLTDEEKRHRSRARGNAGRGRGG